MNNVKLKYPMKVAGVLYPKGLVLKQLSLTESRRTWPGLQASQDGMVAVQFPDLGHPTMVEQKQVEKA